WTGPIPMGPSDYAIRGMAGLSDVVLYASMDMALTQLGGGDFVYWPVRWGGIESTNGRGMIHHQGEMFMPVGGGLVRMTSGGQLLQVGLDQNEGLPPLRTGRIISLASLNNWLVAMVDPSDENGAPSV